MWNKLFKTKKYARCVVCKKRTTVLENMPVSERKCFVPGAGQLCRKCCIELYGTDDLRSLRSKEFDQLLMEIKEHCENTF